jgi:glutamyl-tRNA synthetase
MASPPVVRFAPSPTGRIHIGNARTALLNWLFARRRGGTFILRFDDTDIERSKTEYADAIETDLEWLGIRPDLVRRQSERMAAYDAAAAKLKDLGRLYPAYETADELDRRRKRQQARGLPPIYDRAALRLSADERAALEGSGRKPHWRFRLDATTVRWDDLVRGESHIDCASLSDPILRREDESYLYTLPSVVDDIDFGVTHVIRGEDHVTNTAVQIQIFEALAGAAPSFGHHNLLTDAGGAGLSKRTGALSIGGLRTKGIESLAVAALAVLVGSAEAVRPVASLDELATLVDLSQLSRGAARFDEAELEAPQRRGSVAGRSRQPFAPRGCGDLATGGGGRDRPNRRGTRLSEPCCLIRSRRPMGPVDLGRMDGAPQRSDWPQRAGFVPPLAPGPNGPGGGAGPRSPPAANWPL